MLLATITQASSGPTTAEFIVSLVIVGVLGPALGVLAAQWADRRRFAHERGLKASDDLVERIDDVARSFDELNAACSTMRISAILFGPENAEVLQAVQAAEGVHIRCRALTSRLRMRPHADPSLVEEALAAANSMNAAIENVRNANIRRQAAVKAAGQPIVIGAFDAALVEARVRAGQDHMDAFEAHARAAVGRLLA